MSDLEQTISTSKEFLDVYRFPTPRGTILDGQKCICSCHDGTSYHNGVCCFPPYEKSDPNIEFESPSSGGTDTIPTQETTVKYGVILADPPWKFNDKLDDSRTLTRIYPTMTTEEIMFFKLRDKGVHEYAAKNSVLLLWATNAMLREALKVMESWGAEYKTNFVWCKTRMGMGHYFRSSHEILLLGTYGKPRVNFKGQLSWGIFPQQDHSHKPEEIYDVIERMFAGPYLELFARRGRYNWDGHGDQL